MRALSTLIRQDALLSWRNGLVIVTVVTLAVIVALYWTLPLMLPGEIELTSSQIFHDATADGSFETFMRDSGADPGIFAPSRDELETRVNDGTGITGVVVTGDAESLAYEFVFKNVPGEKVVKILEAAMRNVTAGIRGEALGEPVRVDVLRPGSVALAANQSLVTVMLAFEAMILGFLFVAVVIFGEKKEGSMRAYRVSPSGLVNYVVSKTLVFTMMSTVYGLLMVLLTIGPGANFLALAPALFLACAVMTTLGLAIAVFFTNISEWFAPGVLALSINMVSIVPYQIPTFQAGWLTYLPGYHVIFGVTEILFPTGKVGFAGPMYTTLGIWFAAAAAFALYAVNRNVMREA
jgi:hypothetical protein